MQCNNIHSSNPHVQETLDRFIANQDIDGGHLDRIEAKMMKAVFMEVLHNPDWVPTPHIERLLIDINEKLKLWFH